LLGTFEAQARIHLLDCNRVESGQSALVQIHLPRPCVAQPQDRFILRSSSSDVTIGGGEILDVSPLHHKRRPLSLVEQLKKVSDGKLPQLLALEIQKWRRGIAKERLASIFNVSTGDIEKTEDSLPGEIIILKNQSQSVYIYKNYLLDLTDELISVLRKFHMRYPLQKEGRTIDELLGILGFELSTEGKKILEIILSELRNQGKISQCNHTWILSEHNVNISTQLSKSIGLVDQLFINSGTKVLLQQDIALFSQKNSIAEKELKQILRHLQSQGNLYLIDGNYIHATIVDSARRKLLNYLSKNEGITVAQFRDLLEANRKICLLLVGLFDGEEIIRRDGDLRFITDKGRSLLSVTK
jgi:selenocysteine-specific elongation factor